MFHRDFIKQLIQSGYEDAKQKNAEINLFFSISEKKDLRNGIQRAA